MLDQAVADGGGEARGRGQARLGLVVVLAGSALFVAATSYVNWVKYATLRSTYPTDLASFNNPMLNFALGRDRMYLPTATWFSPGDHDGPSLYRSSHFTPLRLFLLPPLYALWPHISFLMVVQSALIASGAIALYAFAVGRTGLRWTGFVLAGSFLLHPVVLHMAFNDFREIQLGLGPALFALAAHAQARWGRFGAAALLMLAARVEYAFLLALFPVLNWRLTPPGQRGRAFWLVPTAVALVWYALGGAYHYSLYGVPVPHLAPSGPLSAGVPEGLPGRVPAFLGLMLAPGAAALLTPEGFAAALPFVAAARRVTAAHTLPLHHLQHLSPAVAATMWAFASSLVRLAPALTAMPRRRSVVAGGLALAAGLSFAPFAWAVSRSYLIGGTWHLRLDQVDAALPLDATVLAAPRLAARFSGHSRLLSYRALPAARGAAPSREEMMQRLLVVADLVVTEREAWLDELVARSGRFQPPVAAAGAHLFLVRPGVARPADADCALEEILGWRQLEPRRLRWIDLCEPYFTGK